ncbi:MAG: asparagine synthase (glutamine-hydrolyzing) [Planctomycetaceae bacterium]|nr:asparagine synthase (glutamine-hydrolyzing) [Planctomycetaceae bacterium]
MCGIAGFIDGSGRITDVSGVMADMSEAIRHRGPDGEGASYDPDRRVALVHRRLAIQDPSDAGRQPMSSASGRFEIVYNGEIYDFPECRRDLEVADHRFRTGCDTEVLLAAFEIWGIEPTLRRVDGMFAFAVLDRDQERVTLARDRAGQKPLLLAVAGDSIAFASDLRALEGLPEPFATRLDGIDEHALRWYLANGAVPWPMSIRPGVEQVAPGGLVEIDLRNLRIDRRRWWTPPLPADDAEDRATDPTAEDRRVLDAVRESVHRRCRADRALGVFLSAGLDSRLVAALAAEARPGLPAFTLGMPGPFDETAEAAEVAAQLGLEHHAVRPTDDDVVSTAETLHAVADEPFADSSLLATTLLARAASSSIAVALSGDGGDELFGGYRRHAMAANWNRRNRMLRAVALVAENLPESVSGSIGRIRVGRGTVLDALRKIEAVPRGLAGYLDLRECQGDASGLFDRSVIDIRDRVPKNPWDGLFPEWNGVRSMMAADFRTYLPDDPLVKIDRGTMHHGLECRSPFLGRGVVDTANTLPTASLFDGSGGRRPIRSALRSLGLSDSGRKRGFAVPLHDWLQGPLRPWAESLLTDDADDPLDQATIGQNWLDLMAGRRDLATGMWTVLSWRAWLAARS